MNQMEFEIDLGWLERQYCTEDKAAAYTNDQKDTLWEEFKTLNSIAWRGLTRELVRRYSWMPKTSQFYSVLQESEKEEGGRIDRDIRHVDEPCNICDRLGLRWGIFQDPETRELREAMAKCSCRNAENWSKKIPTVAAVEASKNSGLIDWAEPGRINRTMDMHRERLAAAAAAAAASPEKQIPNEGEPL